MRLIDADKFLSQIEDQYMEHDITRQTYIDLEDRILQQPTAEPERKRGEWLMDEYRFYLLPVCSVCGGKAYGSHAFDAVKSDFCPHCGADMRGGQE